MITIESLVDMGANVRLEVTPTDLKMFAESIIQRTIVAQQEERQAAIQREAEETYLNTKQVRELLNVCEGTLNLWAKVATSFPSKSATRICIPNPMYAVCRQVISRRVWHPIANERRSDHGYQTTGYMQQGDGSGAGHCGIGFPD